MTIKYKLGFTIDSEVMFMLLSKFLPIQDLSVEEVVVPVPDPAIRFDKRFDLPKPKRKQEARHGGGGARLDLTRGVNAIVIAALADGQGRSQAHIKEAVSLTPYSVAGVGSKLARLLEMDIIQKHKGMYSLTPKGMAAVKPREEVA
jgi:hypothetical protein